MSPDVVVPIFVVFFVFGAPVAAFIVHRVLKHQERIEMIRAGYMPDLGKVSPPPPYAAGRAGAMPPQPPPQMMGYPELFAAQASLRKGISVALVGFAILVGLYFINPYRPGPWLLGGLIPMFVGIAQILIAMLSGARFGPPAAYGPPPAPPSAPPPGENRGPEPRDFSAGSYAYRPGSTTGLEPPAGPPDRR